MIAKVFSSKEKTLFIALEEIYMKFKEDFFIKEFDFVIFAISPQFMPEDINPTIKRIFNTDNYVAFNAINAFANVEITDNVSAVFIKFEKNGKINKRIASDLSELNKDTLNIILTPFQEGVCISNGLKNIEAPLIGGVCSGEKAYVYTDNKIIKDKAVVLDFDNVDFEFGISLGYKPIGPNYEVQVVNNNRVYVVDYEDASLLMKSLLKNTDNNITNLWYSPILVISDKDGLVDVVRTFKDIKENEYVEFFGKIEKDSFVKMSFATKEMLLEADEKTAIKIKKSISPELVFNFSCVAREFILDDKKEEENKIYSKILNAPLFGFFTYGEIGPNHNFEESKLYNQSSLVVAMKEQ